jgi:assimilatory nitrate reductase catalytic subunit
MEAIRGEIKGLLSICFNPLVSLPDANYGKRSRNWSSWRHRFFMPETARHADVVLAGACRRRKRVCV